MSPTDAAWLSGFIDGEGNVGVYGREHYQARCFIRNTHRESVEHAAALLARIGVQVNVHVETRTRGKDSYFLYVGSLDGVRRLALVVSPYSVTKREQWALVQEYVELRLAKTGRSRPYSSRAVEIVAEIGALNKRWSEEDAVAA